MSRLRLLLSVALYNFTGMFTRPKPIAPVHIGRIILFFVSELCIETIVPFSESLIVRWLQAYTKLHKKFAEEIIPRNHNQINLPEKPIYLMEFQCETVNFANL